MTTTKYLHTMKLLKSAAVSAIAFMVNISFITPLQSISIEDIRVSKQKGTTFLKYIQRSNGAICDTTNPLFETWETILAVSAIYRSDADTNDMVVKKGLSFLKKNENAEGLICHNQKCRQSYCIETTAAYFNLLKLTGKNENITKRLKKIAALQKPGGEWEIGNPDVRIEKDFPSVTAFVLNLFHDADLETDHKKEALIWLLKKQTIRGDWGKAWEYYGCSGYALWPVLEVLQHENSTEAGLAKNKAIAFILSGQNSDGSWFYKDPLFEKQTSAALQTALMLSALQHAGETNTEAVLKGINFLVNSQQKQGNWNGGYFPVPEKRYTKEEYVFATALAIDVMQTYLLNSN